ncbi:MAG: pseudouridine synthase, partial [Candidatus Saccharibacteria bacterium]
MRLARAIALGGVTSRRKAEDLIIRGLVSVNGILVNDVATEVDPDQDTIEVEGRVINREQNVYLMLHKPAGYISSVKDTHGRPTVLELLKGVDARVFPVGRLDYDTEGLILLTNDGEFANLMMHPRYEIIRVYHAQVNGTPAAEKLQQLAQGVMIDGEMTAPAQVRLLKSEGGRAWVELKIHEGRKRQVRKMLAAVGHRVVKLKRVKLGFLELGSLRPGEFRFLTAREVKELINEASADKKDRG